MLDIKRAIKEAGFTQREVAEKLGITLTSLNQIMKGNPTYAKMQQVASAIGVNVSDMLFDEDTSRARSLQADPGTITCPVCQTRFKIDAEEEITD